MTFQKPSKFHGDLTDRVESLEASQRRQDIEIGKVSNIAASIRPGSVFMEWDGESMTGEFLLSTLGVGIGTVIQEYNSTLTSCPVGTILGRGTGTGPAVAITVGSGLTLSGTTLSASGGGGGGASLAEIRKAVSLRI